MLNIYCYRMNCEKNRVDKNPFIEEVDELTGTMRDNCDMLNPVIEVELNYDNDETIIRFNYVFIEQFNRYYFVENVEVVNLNMYVLYLKIDVLNSYKSEIKELYAYVERNENLYSNNLDDDRLQLYPDLQITNYRYFNNFFNDPEQPYEDVDIGTGAELKSSGLIYMVTVVGEKVEESEG